MQALVSSENYFLIAAEYYVQSGDNPVKQTTLTWLDAIQRGLLFYRYYNLNIEIESNPEINIEDPYPAESGVVLRSPPSHITTVFGEKIGFESAEDWLEGIANLSYSLTLPQYDSDDDLNQIYSEFRSSLYPGSRIFREAERDWDDDTYGPIHASKNYETYLSICREIDRWKQKIMAEQTTNRIKEVVEAFQISIRGHPSTHLVQDPLRKMIDKILTSKNETKEEIIIETTASVNARVKRKLESSDIYFGYDSDESIDEIIEEGCRTFYEKIFEEMLEGDKIRLADQKEDILDAFYLIVKRRGAN
jgi:CRISPR type I-D-associated protein Csc3/Cas10d